MPTNVPPNFNYAKYFGIESVAASVVFVALYIGFLYRFIRQSIRIPTYVHFVLVFFCVSECHFTLYYVESMLTILCTPDYSARNSVCNAYRPSIF